MKNIRKSYMNTDVSVEILHGIDLHIKEGEMVAIMGASGSGKSTLLGVLGCLDRCTSGELEINGMDTRQLSNKQINKLRNREIGFIFQKFHLFEDKTVIENVMMPAFYNNEISYKEGLKRAEQLLDMVGIYHKLYNIVGSMSGGECQRVAIARALINEPMILLADEPTGNLDNKTSHEVMNMLIKIHEERKNTMVIVTHDPNVAKRCQRILFIHDGKVTNDNYIIS